MTVNEYLNLVIATGAYSKKNGRALVNKKE